MIPIAKVQTHEIAYKLGAELTSSFKDAFKEAKKSMRGLENAGKAMQSIGKKMTIGVTAPIVGLGTAAVSTFTKFDDSMRNVGALSGATGEELQAMRDLAKDLGRDLPWSASESADAMGYLALAGWDTNEILEATPGLLSLASAANMDLANAADIVSDVMSAFQMSADEAGAAADMFAATATNSNTDVEQLGEAMKQAGAGANSAGMDLAQTSAVLGVFADSGIKGSMAGTTMTAMLRDLKQSSEDGMVAVGDASVALYDQQGNMRDLGSVMADVEAATKGMSTQQRDAAMDAIFSTQAMRGANIMLATGSDRYNELEDAIRNSNGTAEEMADLLQGGIGGAFSALSSAVESLAISFGETLAPYVTLAANKVQEIVAKFSTLSERTRLVIVTIAGIAAAIGPVLLIVGTLIIKGVQLARAIKVITSTMKTFNLMMSINPAALVIVGIIALIAVLVLAYNKVEWFRDEINAAWQWMKDVAVQSFEWISNVISVVFTDAMAIAMSVVNHFKELWVEHGEFIMSLIQAVFDTIVSTIQIAMEFIQGIFEVAWPIISNVIMIAWESIRLFVQSGIDLVVGIIDFAMNLLQGNWSEAWEAIKSIATNIVDNIVEFFTSIDLFEVGKSIINGLIEGIKSMGSAVISSISGIVPGPLKGAAKKVIGMIPGFAKGGIVDQPTLAWVGEGGDTETVIPWNNSSRSRGLWFETGKQLGMFGDHYGGQSNVIDFPHPPHNDQPGMGEFDFGEFNTGRSGQGAGDTIVYFQPKYNIDGGNHTEVVETIERSNDDLRAELAQIKKDDQRRAL